MTEKQAVPKISAYCSKAERCEYDVRKKLLAWKLEDAAINRIIAILRAERFLDDKRYVLSFVRDKMRFNKWGQQKIRFELKKKRIPDNLIQAAFDELSDDDCFEESLMGLLQTKLKTVKATNDCERKMKLFRFAAGRGFRPDLIRQCLNKLITVTIDDEYPV
ncbi:MAG: RecX family transcriptional regulator [Prevotella sp.]|jgi:regulatory protein|nr:RecX family transcriptional regulator [Prevotella sp.]